MYCSFNDAVSSSDHTVSDRGMIHEIDESERVWQEAVVAYFKVICHWSEGTVQNHEKLQDNR
jgi:hypothetical protein